MQSHPQQPNQSRKQYWMHLISEWQESGEPILSFCKERKLPISSFYQWRNRLYPDFPKRGYKKVKTKAIAPLFVPVEVKLDKGKANTEETVLYYPNGCHLRLGKYFDLEMITKINQAMGV